jgi:chromosome segregation ATPase
MDADRKKDKEDFMAKLDADRKADKEERKADRETEKEEIKAAMRSMRSELDETIQHRIENIFHIFEHDRRILQTELTKRINKIEEKLQTAELSLCARTTKLLEDLTKNYNETCAAIEEAKRKFRARLEVVQTRKYLLSCLA